MRCGTFWGAAAAAFLMLNLSFVSGCADADDAQQDNPGQSSHGSVLTSEPSVLRFDGVAVGAEATRSVDIVNRGRGSVEISRVELHEEFGPDFDSQREFFRAGQGWSALPATLEFGERLTLPVRFARKNDGEDRGTIAVYGSQSSQPLYEVPIEAPSVAPRLLAPEQLDFGRVPHRPDEPSWRGESKLIPIHNIGLARLRIDAVYIAESDRFEVSFPQPTERERDENLVPDPQNDIDQWPDALAPGESMSVRVWFRPEDNLPESGSLVFETNDRQEPLYAISLSSQLPSPCIDVVPGDEVRFDYAPVDEEAVKTVTIENCSRAMPLEISSIGLTGNENASFSLANNELSQLPASIEPGEEATVDIVFRPTATMEYEGELRIASNASVQPDFRLPLVGKGTGECPQALARARVLGATRWHSTIEAAPINTIEFDASESFDPDGSVERYEWTVLSRPPSSTQRLVPDASASNPRLFLDRAGTYEVELKVFDDEGIVSCGERAIVTIISATDGGVHVQLVWQTPADADQGDSVGTDLDLHYLHPNGHWDEGPWDIFWRNPTADWGMQGDNRGDPSLDRNDTDGYGPENLTHLNPRELTYRTGVYYKSDNGLGASYATVRIYVNGVLESELQNRYLGQEGKFWEVAEIDWASRAVSEVDKVYDGFPEAP